MSHPADKRDRKKAIRKRIRYCPVTDKVQYPRRREALRVLNSLRGANQDAKKLHGVYKCEHCNRWHLTKQEARP